jgi:hypothetical protein
LNIKNKMGNFLIAAYNLQLKAMYSKVKEQLPGKLVEWEPTKNKKRADAYMLPWVRKAYRKGVDYAIVDTQARTGQEITPDYAIDGKTKEKLLLEFIERIDGAAAVYQVNTENYKSLKKLQPGVTKQVDPQKDQIWNEYVNAVLTAANNLILRAGALGGQSVYERIK